MRAGLTLCVCVLTWALPLPSAAIGDCLDRLSDSLVFVSPKGGFQAQFSGLADFEVYLIDQNPPGLIFSGDDVFFNPRLTLFLDTFAGDDLYGFAKFRFDRGFDPGYMEEGDARADEYFLRYSPGSGLLNIQVGRFATIFGNWAGRHDSWENPFINAPLPYENVTVILDHGVLPGPGVFLSLRNRPDVKKNWVPIIWGPVYTAGVSVSGKFEQLNYAFSVKNAALSSRPNDWEDFRWNNPTFTGRIGFEPDESLSFGVSASYGSYLQEEVEASLPADREVEDFKQFTIGGDLSWARGRLQVWAELIHSRFDVPNVETVGTTAYYVEGKYKLTTHLFAALRWGQQYFDKIGDGNGGSQRWDRGIAKIELSLGYRLNRHIQLKFQYGFAEQNGALEQGRHSVASQLTLKF